MTKDWQVPMRWPQVIARALPVGVVWAAAYQSMKYGVQYGLPMVGIAIAVQYWAVILYPVHRIELKRQWWKEGTH